MRALNRPELPEAGIIASPSANRAADRTSCTSAAANQLRLYLHAGAYWLMWTLRAALPKRSPWRRAQFDTERMPRRADHAPAARAAAAHAD